MIMFALYLFDTDWRKVMSFKTEKEAELFVSTYPLWGADWSRKIRTGNWQVVEE